MITIIWGKFFDYDKILDEKYLVKKCGLEDGLLQ